MYALTELLTNGTQNHIANILLFFFGFGIGVQYSSSSECTEKEKCDKQYESNLKCNTYLKANLKSHQNLKRTLKTLEMED